MAPQVCAGLLPTGSQLRVRTVTGSSHRAEAHSANPCNTCTTILQSRDGYVFPVSKQETVQSSAESSADACVFETADTITAKALRCTSSRTKSLLTYVPVLARRSDKPFKAEELALVVPLELNGADFMNAPLTLPGSVAPGGG